jgi:hypothetical protein
MISSLSFRTRFAAASTRASGLPAFGFFAEVLRALVVARFAAGFFLVAALVERELEAREPAFFGAVDRVRRAPPPELELELPPPLDPPLLACGIVPPW